MQKLSLAALALVIGGLAASAGAQTSVNTDITTNTTWSGTIVLERPIFVRGATLTIQPGTIVRGQPRTAAVSAVSTAGSPGALIVTQTGRIIANGNALAPIIMTTAATDNDDNGVADNVDLPANAFNDAWNPGDAFLDDTPGTAPLAPINKAGFGNVTLWGGLVILGNAPTNLADVANVGYGRGTVEGLVLPGFSAADATYGGEEPHDNSGSLKFVSVRHAGDELGAGNELNGVTLGGVGDGTVLENVEVYCNFDDGFEWFGGTVNGKNLGSFFVGDDSFDVDQGYTGVNQFMFAIQPFFNTLSYINSDGNPTTAYGSASGDKVGELDGDDYRPDLVAFYDNVNLRVDSTSTVVDGTPSPLSGANLYNLTAIGTTPDVANPALPLGITAASANRGVQMRNGFAGNLYDSIVVNTGSAKGIDLVLVPVGEADGAPGFDVVDNANAGLISVVCSTFQNTGAIANPSAEQTAINNGDTQTSATTDNNVVNLVGFPGLANESTYFDPTGNATGKLDATLKAIPINPRPNAGLTGTVGCVAPQGPGLRSVVYRGAFERVASKLWTTDWTALNIGGLLAD